MDIYNIRVSKFLNYKTNRSSGTVNLWEWLLKENEYTSTVSKIRSISNKEERKKMKSSLPAVTISCICNDRRVDKVLEYTGIICIDIDGKDNSHLSDIAALKERLSQLKYILYCGLSVSGNGLFCLIQIADPLMHKQHFYALEKEFKNMGIIIDSSCSDICRLRGYSFDDSPYVNPRAEIYDNVTKRSSFESQCQRSKKIIMKQSLEGMEPQQESQSLKSLLLQPTKGYIQVLTMSKTDKVKGLIERVIESKTDITDVYTDWIAICGIIKNYFGEDGRELFHQISSFYPNYSFDESNEKYLSIERWKYKYNSDQIFMIAAKYGLS